MSAQDPARHTAARRGYDAAGAADHLAGPPEAARPRALRRVVVPAAGPRLLRRGPPNSPFGRPTRPHTDDEPAAGEGLDLVVDRDELESGSRRLSMDHRAVVVLHRYLDLPLDEVADILGIRRDGPFTASPRDSRVARALDADARPARGRRLVSSDRDTTRLVRPWLDEGAAVVPAASWTPCLTDAQRTPAAWSPVGQRGKCP